MAIVKENVLSKPSSKSLQGCLYSLFTNAISFSSPQDMGKIVMYTELYILSRATSLGEKKSLRTCGTLLHHFLLSAHPKKCDWFYTNLYQHKKYSVFVVQ